MRHSAPSLRIWPSRCVRTGRFSCHRFRFTWLETAKRAILKVSKIWGWDRALSTLRMQQHPSFIERELSQHDGVVTMCTRFYTFLIGHMLAVCDSFVVLDFAHAR